jgi:pimeloyl-ACP methyl ester carboxylesterase
MRSRILWMVVGLSLAATSAWAEVRTEIGEIGGVPFRIDIPDNWNRRLAVYLRGYAPLAPKYRAVAPNPFEQVFLDQGYALVQSAFSAGGWSVSKGVVETEALVKYFSDKHGVPERKVLVGHSMGGFMVMLMLERSPDAYAGGLALCAPLGPAMTFLARRAFDVRVAFDAYFPGIFPAPGASGTPPEKLDALITERLEAAPDKAESLRRFAGLRTNREVLEVVRVYSGVLEDIAREAGGNPYDNRTVVYQGSTDDVALNAAVTRYTADPAAAAYVRRQHGVSGELKRPLLAVQNVYDPYVPAWLGNLYGEMVAARSQSGLFSLIQVPKPGHCAISAAEAASAFATLQSPSSGL